MLSCYNRGCGQDFDPEKNENDSCRHHPGMPFFHDAYKGWSCCQKKTVNFTDFLNIKGCALSKHSNEKPPEPEKSEQKIVDVEESAPAVEPIKPSTLQRSDFNSPMTKLTPTIAPSLKQSIDNILPIIVKSVPAVSGVVVIGTNCKNGGCNCSYNSPASNDTICVHHPGVPIFHEGLKYWSCCTKRTSDFTSFLNQVGCIEGIHKWIQHVDDTEAVKCRYDWHQTATNVVISIYAKMYHYEKSFVEINPIRLKISLVFPQKDDAEFNLDLELRGIIDVTKTTAQMYGTKVEIIMDKAEPGQWPKLDFPRDVAQVMVKQEETENNQDDDGIESDVDLDDIDTVSGLHISDAF